MGRLVSLSAAVLSLYINRDQSVAVTYIGRREGERVCVQR